MVKEDKGLARFFIQMAIVLTITFLASNFVGLMRGGFSAEEILKLQTFYLVGGIFAFAIMSFKLYQTFLVKDDKKFGKSVGFASLGRTPHLAFFKRFTGLQIFFLSLIIFLILGLVNLTFIAQTEFGQKSYTGVGFIEKQQFTILDSVIYSGLLIPGSENLGSGLLFAFVIVMLGVLARKVKFERSIHSYMIYILMPVVFLIFGVGNHLLRYRGSEVALTTVGVFWAVGGFLTAISGSFLIFWNLHICNNLFVDLARYFSNESILVGSIVTILILIVIYSLIYSGRIFGRKPTQSEE